MGYHEWMMPPGMQVNEPSLDTLTARKDRFQKLFRIPRDWRQPLITPTLSAAALVFTQASASEPFETPPDEEPSVSLPAAQISSEYFHIDSPVHSDGLMHHYIVDSRFGAFPAYGRSALQIRLHEVAALTSIAKTSDVDVALKSVGSSLTENAGAVVSLAKNPVGTVTGIPRGINHLFGGYRAKAQELSDEIHDDTHHSRSSGQSKKSIIDKTGNEAKQYADRYFGLSSAQMRWYQKLGVDPYTTNETLRRAVKHLAKIDAATRFGMHFVPVPGIPYASEIRRALNTIYNEDPAVLRKRRHEALAGYGLSPEEISRFENAILLSPTRQTVLVEAAHSLEGVEGRAELFRHAMSVTSEEEIALDQSESGT